MTLNAIMFFPPTCLLFSLPSSQSSYLCHFLTLKPSSSYPPFPILDFSLPSFSYLSPVSLPSPIWALRLLFPSPSTIQSGIK